MKRIICIFGLLFLASCEKETIPVQSSPCSLVIISDALPVQFWLSDCDTYNETVPKGVHEKCFCAPWQCDDEILIQLQDDASPDPDYYVIIKDSDDLIRGSQPLVEISSNEYQASVIPLNHGICDEDIQLILYSGELTEILAPDDWVNTYAASPMTPSGNTFTQNVTSGSNWGNDQPFTSIIPLSTVVAFDVIVTITGTWTGTVTLTFTITRNGGVDTATQSFTFTGNVASVTRSVSLTKSVSQAQLEDLRIALSGTSSGTAAVTITLPVGDVIYYDEDNVVAKSDCLDVATTHDETELIEYSNARNFAGLIYSDVSPDAAFNIRVPCRFFHEVFPEEDEAIELTSSVVTTSSQLKSQKLLEVKHVPYYFHKKLQLILKHQTLTINTVSYKKEEKYEINEGNKQWPLKSATCLLTEKNSVLRNVL